MNDDDDDDDDDDGVNYYINKIIKRFWSRHC